MGNYPTNQVGRKFARNFSRSTSLIALGACMAFGANSASAQEATQTEQTVVVTGFRASLQNAVNRKKIAAQIVESVSAEDIGKLPDASIAESIARLPGLTSQRLSGRAQVITIRGFAPDLSTTLLNGREQVSTGDNRAVEFDQYPSEIMAGVDVYKTPVASLVGQGLAGTVNLRTIRPLSHGKRVVAVSGRVETSSLGALNAGTDEYGYRLNGTYVDQFMDGKLGVAIAGGYTTSPYQIEEFEAWGYANVAPNTYAIGGQKSFVTSTTLKRVGLMGTIEFKPTDNFTTTIDAYWSDFEDHQIKRGIEMPLVWGSNLRAGYKTTPITLSTGQTVNLVTSGIFDDVKGVINNHAVNRDATILSVGWNNVYHSDNGWKYTGDLSYSKIDRNDLNLETNAGTGRGPVGAKDSVGFQMVGQGAVFTHQLNYADYNSIVLTSPQGWGAGPVTPGGQDGYYNNRIVEDQLTSLRLDAAKTFETGPIESIQFGINYSERDKSLTPDEYFLNLKANTNGLISVPIPASARLAPTNLGYLGLGPMVSYDPLALVKAGLYNLFRNPNADVVTKGWSLNETITTPYAQANIRGEVFGAELLGNFGMQWQWVEQSSTGWVADGAPIVRQKQITRGTDYVDWLPSLNLTLKYPSDILVRFGAAREVSRPRIDDMSVSTNYGFNTAAIVSGNSPFSGGGGNPYLEPYRANAFDLSVEKYFGRKGFVSLQLFRKDLESYIYRGDLPYDFTGYPVPNPIIHPVTGAVVSPGSISYQGFLNVPLNGQGGRLQGWEFAFTLPFEVINPMLDGFGLTGGVSRTISRVRPQPGAPAEDLPGYSKWVQNLTAYYENHGFSARVSSRYRSTFIGELSGFGGNRSRRRAAPETIIDAQVGYEFQSGMFEGLSISLQGQNLTDERFATYDPVGGPATPINYQIYGKRYQLGFNYKF